MEQYLVWSPYEWLYLVWLHSHTDGIMPNMRKLSYPRGCRKRGIDPGSHKHQIYNI